MRFDMLCLKNLLRKAFSFKNEEYYTEIGLLGKKFRHIKAKKLVDEFSAQKEFINRINFVLNNGINKEKISYEMERFNSLGVLEPPKNRGQAPRLIVSLTSYPERMYDVHFTVYSLLNQTKKLDMLILYLAEDEFPNMEEDLPQRLLKLKENGLTIRWCKNLKSYKKLIPALTEFPNDIIVTADDDIYYPSDWLLKLYESYLKNPDNIHCHRAHRISFKNNEIEPYKNWQTCINYGSTSPINFFTGGGGVLYPPNSLHKDALNEELFLKLAPNADDIWFYAMAVLNNKKIQVVEKPCNNIKYVNPKRELGAYGEGTLFLGKNSEGGNDHQLKNVLEHYPEIKEKILDNSREQYVFEAFDQNIYNYVLFLDHKFAYNYAASFVNKNSNVLEIGSGDGYGTHYLSKYCKTITGVDILDEVVKRANALHGNKKCHFACYDGKNLNYPKNSFDMVISFHVIEHVRNVKAYLKNIKKVLKKDGVCILTTPSRTYRLTEKQKPWNNEHLREYNSRALNKEIGKVFKNFEILSVSAKQEILDVEFSRVAQNRSDFSNNTKEINANIDYKKEFSINDFYVSKNNLDSGIDLMVICKNDGFNSKLYWEERYLSKNNSGAGSYGRLADFKAEIINNFVQKHDIKNVIEFGCGDGNQLKKFKFEKYTGFDVSKTVLDKCKKEFSGKPFVFKNMEDYNGETADLTLSLDVIYHLIEDDVFCQYMETLFNSSKKYVIIYSSNKDENCCRHVKHRKFTDWIETNEKEWVLKEKIKNKYQYSKEDVNNTSFADFYIFQKGE